MAELHSHIEFLANRWCSSRNFEPLRLLLNAKASLNGLTDGWAECRTNLQSIRVNHGRGMSEEEMNALIEAIHIADKAMERDAT